MTKFFKFITTNNAYILLLVYCGIAGILIVYQEALSLKSLLSQGMELRAGISHRLSDLHQYLRLKEENERLTLQNAILLADAVTGSNALRDSARVNRMATFVHRHPAGFTPARIVERRFNTTENVLVLNVGSRQGVAENMPVLTPDGLVGRVIRVTNNYSKVMPVIHSEFSVGVMSDSNMTQGLLRWNGKREQTAQMNYVPLSSSIDVGETLYTTDFSTFALRGIPVGRVSKVAPETQFFSVDVALFVDFSSLTHVLVADKTADPEKMELLLGPSSAGEALPEKTQNKEETP